MMLPVRRLERRQIKISDTDPHLNEEWLVTNGLGGYASGTVQGPLTRRYHGLLIAALPNPLGRTMMLNALTERVRTLGRHTFFLGPTELSGTRLEDLLKPCEFRLEAGLPVWVYEAGDVLLEKRLFLVYRQNTVHVSYRLLKGPGGIRMALRPGIHFRSHDAPVSTKLADRFVLSVTDDGYEVCEGSSTFPTLRMTCDGGAVFTSDRKLIRSILYRTEENRGYESQGAMWSPGYFRFDLSEGQSANFVASVEPWHLVHSLNTNDALEAELERRKGLLNKADPVARAGVPAELTLAADQFLITPVGRTDDAARAHAAGQELRTVIAGYHWFTDWGRDTMISLEGLTLSTGRTEEADWILRTFGHYVRDGLIPNMFPEGQHSGLYHTADATLWFFHAIHRYVTVTGDRLTLQFLLPKLLDIVQHHVAGTHFGIKVDPTDGLLSQGEEGYQLTWMDAKVGDWVVTPRRGKPVEINALWFNALSLLATWLDDEARPERDTVRELAAKCRESFQRRFWFAEGGYLYDVIDGEHGDDSNCRPNQIFAISLPCPVLGQDRWKSVLDVVKDRLLTPVGLRSLAPGSPEYKPKYDGDLRARDAAYHQGTVWGWLIGPFIDAWLKVYPNRVAEARTFLDGFVPHLDAACVGSISEVFDAEEPHTPRACIAQAWSVAEVLRCWVKLGSYPPSKGDAHTP